MVSRQNISLRSGSRCDQTDEVKFPRLKGLNILSYYLFIYALVYLVNREGCKCKGNISGEI
jgi:hypothetical protein